MRGISATHQSLDRWIYRPCCDHKASAVDLLPLYPPLRRALIQRGRGECMFEAEIWVALAGVVGAVAFMLAGRPAWDRFLPW